MSFAIEHASAVQDLKDVGAAVTFTDTTATHDPTTGTFTSPTSSTVSGYAMKKRSDPKRYEALGLSEQDIQTLLFVPNTYGDTPSLGSTVSWMSRTYTIRDVDPLAPDGTAILAEVVIAR